MIFKRRLVRVHFAEPGTPSVEGILVERPRQFYRLAQVKVVAGPEESYDTEGEAWIPRERVLWVQVLG